jgi:uncharacterized protein YecT (DUF1311 family)
MKSVAKYRRFAEEYRKLSDKLDNPKDKEALQLMARAWDSVACEDRLISEAVERASRSHERCASPPLDLSNSVQAWVTFRNNFRVQPILWLPRIMPQDQCSHGFNLL